MAGGSQLDALRPAGRAGWLTLDDSGRVVTADERAVDLLGVAHGDRPAELVAPCDRRRFDELVTPSVAADPVLLGGRRVDGLPFAVWAEFVRGPSSSDLLVVRRAGGPVRRADVASPEPEVGLDDIERASRGIDHVLSHDLRGSLRQATGFVTVVRRDLDQDGQPAGHLGIALRSLGNADLVASSVVRWLRFGDAPLLARTLPVAELVAQAVAALGERVTHDPSAPDRVDASALAAGPAVVADPAIAVAGLVELLANAVTFWPGDGVVEVAGELDDRWCTVVVRDRGPGVADPDAAFAPGRMLQPRGDFPGVGMGLPLAGVVARRHGGWCEVAAREDGTVGTAARIALPVG